MKKLVQAEKNLRKVNNQNPNYQQKSKGGHWSISFVCDHLFHNRTQFVNWKLENKYTNESPNTN